MTSQAPILIALGNFDGIHRGHQQVINPILRSPLSAATHSEITTAVVSFTPHPQAFFTGNQRLLLTPLAEKRDYLQSIGVDDLILLHFDAQMAKLTPREFVKTVLVERLNAQLVSVGQNFRFGHRRAGTAEDLRRIAADWNIAVHITPLHCCGGDRVSSSAIRQALDEGNIATANRLLGRPYCLLGSVVHGQQLGRTIGFPTANLALPTDKFLPRRGVYAVQVNLSPTELGYSSPTSVIPGVMNIGYRPTVDGIQQTTEVHLLEWNGDLYGRAIAVYLEAFLRPEQKFESLDRLKDQIFRDCEQARSHLHSSKL